MQLPAKLAALLPGAVLAVSLSLATPAVAAPSAGARTTAAASAQSHYVVDLPYCFALMNSTGSNLTLGYATYGGFQGSPVPEVLKAGAATGKLCTYFWMDGAAVTLRYTSSDGVDHGLQVLERTDGDGYVHPMGHYAFWFGDNHILKLLK
ncbi:MULTISPECIES: hypothetical protein [unclassified Streptomyces]|uniref:hypothetical protein n=1 Tax=unclassified Streptomyces TaxID=2593676 RepID=UPI00324E6989